jgi:DNA-binding PadR family transcriptional regulator
MSRNVSKFSPLTEATYYILISLIQPIHGYGIIKKVEENSGGRIRLAAGTLYGAISTLQNNKLIVPRGEDKDKKRRKLYQITEMGRKLIKYEIGRLEEMAANGKKEIGDNYE